MAFNISEWQAHNKQGFLKPSNFLVYIYPPNWALRDIDTWDPGSNGGPDLAWLAAGATLPGLQILTTESRLYGQGPMVKMPYDIAATDINLKFYVDGTSKSMLFFYDWLRNVVNLSHTQDQVRSGAFSQQISYRADYTTKIDIMLYGDMLRDVDSDPQDGALTIFTMYDAFPISIGETSLDWQSGNEIMTFNVTFSYRSFEWNWLGLPVDYNPMIRAGMPTNAEIDAAIAGIPPAQLQPVPPVNLSEQKPQSKKAAENKDGGTQSTLSKINAFATNVRETSKSIRTESVSQLKNVESQIFNNEYVKTAQNVIGAVNDVRKTLGVLKGLNNTFKSDLRQQLNSVTGGRSLNNLFKI